jgi:hypothetical protein
MKKKSKEEKADELRPEYDLRQLLRGGIQGKYAQRCEEGTNIVLLAPDVAKAFPTQTAVNEALRLVIELGKLSRPNKQPGAKA